MPSPLLERVTNCGTLPSLPAVAMKVLELTRDPKVSIAAIANTVQMDPALSTKVLRTVNSSYYALTVPCPNISRAMSLLGLNTVKALVLGFSLVDCTKRIGREGPLDLTAFWRRAVYGAASARVLAVHTRACDPEEAFVGALLQDIGILACFAALKDEYLSAISGAEEDHDALGALEHGRLGFDHAQVGRLLAEKWRLPPQLVECVALHHADKSSPVSHERLVRTVQLSRLVAGTLTLAQPREKHKAFLFNARQWFELPFADANALIESAARGARELAKSLDLRVGAPTDVTAILSEAHERLAESQEAMQQESLELKTRNEELARQSRKDGLTGAFNRAHFDQECKAVAATCTGSGKPYTVIFLDADKFKSVNDTHGHQAGDAVLIELSSRLRSIADRVGTFCRYGGEEFVLVSPGVDLERGKKLAELLRRVVCGTPFDLSAHGIAGLTLPITISVGVASCEPGTPTAGWSPEQTTHAADQAVYAAKQAGRNCVRWGAHEAQAPAEGATRTVLLVEDDVFAARLAMKSLASDPALKVVSARNLAEARVALSVGKALPDVALIDLNLPDGRGTELLPLLRSLQPARRIVSVIMSGDPSEANRVSSLAAGAEMFLDKVEFLANTSAAMAQVKKAFPPAGKAA